VLLLTAYGTMTVAGYPIGTPGKGVSSMREMAAIWLETDDEEDWLEAQLFEELNPSKNAVFGIKQLGESGQPQYIYALCLEEESRLRPQMRKVKIKGGLYAVFTTPPVDLSEASREKYQAVIRLLWNSIFVNFFDGDSSYEYDASRMDFEYYDDRSWSEIDPSMEIWVPVRKRT